VQAALLLRTGASTKGAAQRAASDIAGIQRELQRLPIGAQAGAPAAGSPPLVTADNVADLSAEQKAAIAVKEATDKERGKADVVQETANKKIIASGTTALEQVDQILKHPGLSKATGLQGQIDPRANIPGTDAFNFTTRLKQLKGGVFLNAYETLRGGGQITEIEGAKAEDAIARMDRAQSTEEFTNALKDYRAAIAGGIKKAGGTLPPGIDISAGSKPGEAGGAGGVKVPGAVGMKTSRVDAKPQASAVPKGSVITNSDGVREISDGLKWQPYAR